MPLYGIGPRLCSIEYDLLGKATKFSLNGVALLTKVYDYDNNSVTAKYHRGEGAEDEICTEMRFTAKTADRKNTLHMQDCPKGGYPRAA